ncbi:carbohydrate sulfotransferase 11-like isoform X1 [Branchiostoma floridae]|uniref:Carbohydrate sulfotransferase n=1 Tax=Branchiostoma floridae TaxID=7739 RepID=A0A9J7MB95_BRAFL|nr:carbohydrate sulfotransferase 11-like isoform X1 [Branchiostoma floridae]
MTAKELKINKGSITSRLLSTYNKEEIDHRVSSYYSIVVTRNPIERLASAWISRFLYNHHLRYNDRYGSMLQTVSNTSNTENIKDKNNQQVPFLAFIRAATDNRKEWQNRHWIPVSDACTPCKIHYDYIAHTETLADDLRLFLRKVGVTNRDDILPQTKKRGAEKKLRNLFALIPLEDLRRVARKFKADFEMFGYSYEEEVLKLSQP